MSNLSASTALPTAVPELELIGYTGSNVILDGGDDAGIHHGVLLDAARLLGSPIFQRLPVRDQALVRRVAAGRVS